MKREPEVPAKKRRKPPPKDRGQPGNAIRDEIGRDQAARIRERPVEQQLEDIELQRKVLELKMRHIPEPQIAQALGIADVHRVRRIFGRATEHVRLDHQVFCTEKIVECFVAYEREMQYLYPLAFGQKLPDGTEVKGTLEHLRMYHRIARDKAMLVALLNARNIQVNSINVNVAVGRKVEVSERAQMAARRFKEHAVRAIPEVLDVPAEPRPADNRDRVVPVADPMPATGTEGE